ncbi:MAG: Crp/Fnr family transcriptional regulator [Hyphomicrobiaceae bacterium]|nr:MAG: Crp/Fnr family transcriptional regulator [Hyphomicrobiaceae bacterium]
MREYSIGISQDLAPVLSPEQIDLLLGVGRMTSFTRNQVLYRQGEPADHIYLLLDGIVQSLLVNSAGHESLLRIHLPGSILGLTSLGTVPWRDASAKAIEPATVVKIKRDDMERLIAKHTDLALRLIRLLIDRMRDFHFRVGELQSQSVEQRLARVLLAICQREEGGTSPDGLAGVSLTHQDLAHLVNSRRQTVSAILGQFAEAGYIVKKGRRLQLINIKALASLIPN